MKPEELRKIIGQLGRTRADLIAEKIISDTPLMEIYPEADRSYTEPEEGMELTFSVDDEVLIEIFITLIETTPSTTEYKGELPEMFFEGMDRDSVLELFGTPDESRGPVRLPVPIGQTGGWDSYLSSVEYAPGVELMFQYTAEMKVKTVVFAKDC